MKNYIKPEINITRLNNEDSVLAPSAGLNFGNGSINAAAGGYNTIDNY